MFYDLLYSMYFVRCVMYYVFGIRSYLFITPDRVTLHVISYSP